MSGYVIEIPQENMDKNMLARQLRVAAYCRVSTTYEEQKHSLDAQIRYYTQYIQQNPRWKFVAVYADQASGLHTKNRPGYQQMLRDCRRGKINLILVKTLSRFGRDALETISQIRRLKEMNIGVYVESANMNTLSAPEFLVSMCAARDQAESQSRSSTIKFGIQQRMRSGRMNRVESEPYRRFVVFPLFMPLPVGDRDITKELCDGGEKQTPELLQNLQRFRQKADVR